MPKPRQTRSFHRGNNNCVSTRGKKIPREARERCDPVGRTETSEMTPLSLTSAAPSSTLSPSTLLFTSTGRTWAPPASLDLTVPSSPVMTQPRISSSLPLSRAAALAPARPFLGETSLIEPRRCLCPMVFLGVPLCSQSQGCRPRDLAFCYVTGKKKECENVPSEGMWERT
jgi:hypothetical protein